jgi:hypothetical protein
MTDCGLSISTPATREEVCIEKSVRRGGDHDI